MSDSEGARGVTRPGHVGDRDPEGELTRGMLAGFTRTELSLVLPLSFAAFFENYDYALFSVAAPVVRTGLGATEASFGYSIAVIRLAAFGSVFLLRAADSVGRRTMLIVSLGAFGLATVLTATVQELIAFTVLGCIARLFLSVEGPLSGLVISEEVRPHMRGRSLSLAGIVGQTAFGVVAVMSQVVRQWSWGWRLLYLFAIIPVGLALVLRRRLPETVAFDVANEEQRIEQSWWPRLERRWWRRVALAMAIFATWGALATAGVYHSANLAQDTYGWRALYSILFIASAPFTFAGFVLGGRGSDRIGRRPVLAGGVILASVGMVVIFVGDRPGFAVGWFLFVFGQAVVNGMWVAYMAELVPTEVRATVTAFVISAQVASGSIGLAITSAFAGSAVSLRWSMVGLGVAAVISLLALLELPETSGRDVVGAFEA